MRETNFKLMQWMKGHRQSPFVQYGAAALTVWVALSVWTFSPMLHRHPFVLLLAAVLFTARFIGFGPAVLGSVLATASMDFFVIPPYLSFGVHTTAEIERLAVFLIISMFGASMARQKTLAESRADRTMREMAAIVEDSCDAIYGLSPEQVVTSWNRAAENLYGFTAEEAVGAPVTQLVPPERMEEARHNIATLSAGGHIDPYRTERMCKDGKRRPILLSISPLFDARGKMVGSSAIARDISVEKVSEEAIRRSEKLATAGRLAASVAHEINNPLEAVVNLLYLARHDPGHADEYLTMAEKEVGRVASIAQQTLGFVRDTNAPGSMDPAAIMDEILQLYSRKLDARRICVRRRYRNGSQIRGFSGELRQLLANLLVNAVDAMAEGGSLQVRVAPGREWSQGRAGVRITVADNGSGIPHESLRQIFEPFYTTKKDSGTGLGLWVSRGIAQKHGGDIRVRSRVSGSPTGTVFQIFLPQQIEANRAA